jgi:hypothetical protein
MRHGYGPYGNMCSNHEEDRMRKSLVRSPAAQTQDALYKKGYKRGASYRPTGLIGGEARLQAWYRDGQMLLLWSDETGSCELYTPLTTGNDLEALIAAIP